MGVWLDAIHILMEMALKNLVSLVVNLLFIYMVCLPPAIGNSVILTWPANIAALVDSADIIYLYTLYSSVTLNYPDA